MSVNARRLSVLGMALGLAVSLGLRSVHAQHAHPDHSATQPAKAQFAGDAYLLSTDPVSGGPLGDKPIIYLHEGRELRFTDQPSLDTFKADPTKYLPKVGQQMIAQQLPFYPLSTCMVSGDKLGGDMGKPVDHIYKNRLVRFCCAGCIKDFNKDPDKWIATLNEAVIGKQGPTYPLTTCMVSGEKLGGDMGKPVDLVVGSRLVRFCCSSCVKDFNKSPATFLKMIDDAAEKKAAESKPGAVADPATRPAPSGHGGHQH